MKTTAYNHIQLGTDEKPLISNVDFKQLVEEFKSNNKQACERLLSQYTLSEFQKNLIKQMRYEL